MITPAILKQLCPKLSDTRVNEISAHLNTICPQYGINSADIMHEFLANLIHESSEFTRYEENLKYSAKRMVQVWPSRFKTEADAVPYAFAPSKLAEKVYGMRKDLGNTVPGDGWLFRGSGAIQMTGRGNFEAFTKWMREKFKIVKGAADWAEAVRKDDGYSIHSACWIFAISKQLIDEAVNDDMKTIVKRINGGLIGYSERLRIYEQCKALIK